MTRFTVLAIAVAALILPAATAASSADDGLIYACVKEGSKKARIVGKPEKCKANERVVSWNESGPPGVQGERPAPHLWSNPSEPSSRIDPAPFSGVSIGYRRSLPRNGTAASGEC